MFKSYRRIDDISAILRRRVIIKSVQLWNIKVPWLSSQAYSSLKSRETVFSVLKRVLSLEMGTIARQIRRTCTIQNAWLNGVSCCSEVLIIVVVQTKVACYCLLKDVRSCVLLTYLDRSISKILHPISFLLVNLGFTMPVKLYSIFKKNSI